MSRSRGRLLVVSAPSGTGKTTLCRRLVDSDPRFVPSVSYTTRKPRPGEVPGRDYHFIARDEFARLSEAGELLEWAEIYGDLYGTGKLWIEEKLREGKQVVLSIDVQGASQLKASRKDAVFVFILPPSPDTLRERLSSRRTETEQSLSRRLALARREMEEIEGYDYILVNAELDETVSALRAIASGKAPEGALTQARAREIRERF
ncbi:MAG: guanylate kinase [Vicinamibacteria bacterium]